MKTYYDLISTVFILFRFSAPMLPEHGDLIARASTPQSLLWLLKHAVPLLPADKKEILNIK